MANHLAVEALGWIGKVISMIRNVRARVARRVIKVKSIFLDLEKLEDGAETEFFQTMREATASAKLGDEVSFRHALSKLTMDDVIYWSEFHRITWENGLKRPMTKLARFMDDEPAQALLRELGVGDEDD